MSPLEKFGALERKAEDPFRTLAEGSASTSAWILAALSLGDAAQRARPLQFVKSRMALLPDGALETAARWSKKHRRRSHRRGLLTTPRGVTERERRRSPSRLRHRAPGHRSERVLGFPLECCELPPALPAFFSWNGLCFRAPKSGLVIIPSDRLVTLDAARACIS